MVCNLLAAKFCLNGHWRGNSALDLPVALNTARVSRPENISTVGAYRCSRRCGGPSEGELYNPIPSARAAQG